MMEAALKKSQSGKRGRRIEQEPIHLSEIVLLLLEPLEDMIEPVCGLDTIDLEPLDPEALDGRPQSVEVALYPGRLEGNRVLGVLRTGLVDHLLDGGHEVG